MGFNYSYFSKSVIQKLLLLALLNWTCWLHASAQNQWSQLAKKNIKNYREKLYIQTDRDLYIIGEQLWLKVYKLNSFNNKPGNLSTVVYVELINSAGFPVEQLKLNIKGNSGSVSFSLSDTLGTGNYLIRVYTNWMKNFGEKSFSFKNISVINPFQRPERIKILQEESAIDTVLFYPESGTLVMGTKSKVGFIAIDKQGNRKDIEAAIVNDKKDTVSLISTNKSGFGTFFIRPDQTENYSLLYTNRKGNIQTFPLCEVKKSGISLSLLPSGQNMQIVIKIHKSPDFTLKNKKYFILVYSNGIVKYAKRVTNDSFRIERKNLPSGISQIVLSDETGNKYSSRWIYIPSEKKIIFNVKTNKTNYGSREKIKVEVTATDSKGNPLKTDLSISVAKSFLINKDRRSLGNGHPYLLLSESRFLAGNSDYINDELLFYSIDSLDHHSIALPKYLPEPEGEIISGTLINSTTKEPEKNTDIVFSLVGKVAKCQFYKTNNSGNFYFVMNETGMQEIVIQPVKIASSRYYIEIEPPFFNSSDFIKPTPYYLDTNMLEKLNKSIISMQVENIYLPYRNKNQLEGNNDHPINFYGDPVNSVQISEFIELTTVREVIKEIVPSVITRKKEDKFTFHLSSDIHQQFFENDPLVIVDGIPFNDIEQILNMKSTDLERIDVINLKYFKDGQIFDGILNFVTKKGNLEALDFDYTVFRQAYKGFDRKVLFYSPNYSIDSIRNSRIPDFRNTLYWNPDLHNRKDSTLSFEFYTSDEPGNYTILIEGISPEGYTGTIRKEITVIPENAEM